MGELPQQLEANLVSLERLNTKLRLNGEQQMRAMERRDRIEKQINETGAPVAVAARPGTPEAELQRLQQQLTELRLKFTDEYPPAQYLSACREWVSLGAQVLGGCCGTTPMHIEALKKGLPRALPV